jgi:nuclear transport factor 2 (NTF2) superfamily protein
MFKKDPSKLEIWSFAASRIKLGYTSSTRDGSGPSSCSMLQDQGHIADNTLMARRSQTPRISSTYAVSTLR